jgi:hypothetical protein
VSHGEPSGLSAKCGTSPTRIQPRDEDRGSRRRRLQCLSPPLGCVVEPQSCHEADAGVVLDSIHEQSSEAAYDVFGCDVNALDLERGAVSMHA